MTTVPARDRLVRHATCLGCGCTCDDIALEIRGGRIVEARNACALGAAWYGDGEVPALALVSGREVPVDEALAQAAGLLTRAERPLVYLAPDISCEAQRAAVALADVLRASLDSVTSATTPGSILAAQEQGRAGATLGEVRHRADVLVFWGVDPALRYPRYSTRYAPEPAGLHVPAGRRSRTVVAVDVGDRRGPVDADLRVAIDPEAEVAALTALAALASGGDWHPDAALAPRQTGSPAMAASTAGMNDTGPAAVAPWTRAGELARVLADGRYVVLVADAEPDAAAARDPGLPAALVGLAQALNGPTRGALSLLRAGGNRLGADAVMTWQTGYPMAVDFARGYPRYVPHGGAAARLRRGAVDAVIVIGAVALVPAELVSMMAHVPRVVIGPAASTSALAGGQTIIDTGVAGIHESGTAIRMDDVPLPLRSELTGPPSAASLVAALLDRVAAATIRGPGGGDEP